MISLRSVRLHSPIEVLEHVRRQVVPEHDHLLPEELQPARVAREVYFWDF